MPTRRRLPSRLFFYSYRSEPSSAPDQHSRAAIGSIRPEGFEMIHEYPLDTFGHFTVVASAFNAGKRWLLFHNLYTEEILTGTIAPDFEFIPSKPAPRRTDFTRLLNPTGGYEHMAVDGLGFLLLVSSVRSSPSHPGSRSRVTLAQVASDGLFVPLHSSTLDIPIPASLIGGAALVGLSAGHAWLAHPPGSSNASIVYVLANGKVVSSRTWSPAWHGIAAHQNVVVLWDSFGKRGEICVLDSSYNLVTTGALGPGSFQQDWTMVANSPRVLLAYHYPTGLAQVRALGQGAFTPTVPTVYHLEWLWSSIAWC